MKGVLFISLLLFIHTANGQGNFMVYQMKGDVKVKADKQNKNIKIGQQLKANNNLLISKGASVVLICENYIPVTIKTAGTYSLTGFLDSCVKETYSLSSAYFKYVWKQLTHTEGSPGDDRRSFMRNTGAVVRGYPCNEISMDPLFDTVNCTTGNFTIHWKTNLPDKLFIELYDAEKDGSVLYHTAVAANYITTDSIKKYRRENETVYWNFVIDGKEICSRKLVRFWKNKEYTTLLTEIKKGIPTSIGEAEMNYTTGFLLESNHFFAAAKGFYQKAVQMNKTEERYQQALADMK